MASCSPKIFLYDNIIAVIGYSIAISFLSISVFQVDIPSKSEILISESENHKFDLLYSYLSANLLSLKLSFVSFVVFLSTHALTLWTRSASVEIRNQQYQNDIINRIDRSFTVRNVGLDINANVSIEESIKQATYVRNTFLNMGGVTHYSQDREQEILKIYEGFLRENPNHTWIDLVSVNEVHEFRHKRIFANTISSFGRHEIKVLRTNMPIVNFIILENEATGYREVYFGWVNDKKPIPSQIFRSSDSAVLSIFSRQFDAMEANKVGTSFEVDYSCLPQLRGQNHDLLVDKKGVWITTLLSLDGQEINYGFIGIDFQSGKAIVKGKLLKKNGKLIPLQHDDTTRSGNQLYFGYHENHEDGKQYGLCVYTFKHKGNDGFIDGFLYENSQAESGRIIGVRAVGLSPSDTFSDSEMRQAISSYKRKIRNHSDKS